MRPSLRPWMALVASCAAVAALPGAGAFASLPPGSSPHEGITADAADGLGFPEDALDALQDAVVRPDADEMEFEPESDEPDRLDATKDYDPSHHCDRVPPATDAAAVQATGEYVRAQLDEARRQLAEGDSGEGVDALGRALHAFQDCFSHTNAVELGPGAAERLGRALRGDGGFPDGLKVTGFAPGTERTEYPEGDPFPHGDHALDLEGGSNASKETMPDGTTKYEAARAAATAATRALLEEFLGRLSAAERDELFSAKQRLAEKLPTPGPGGLAVATALCAGLVVAVLRRRD